METKEERIVHHFIEDHKRLLGAAMLPVRVTHPNEIHFDSIGLQPSGTVAGGTKFAASFTIGKASVFYFGTINDNLEITNEAVAGRTDENVAGTNFNPGADLGEVF